jgi:hypothetical protein
MVLIRSSTVNYLMVLRNETWGWASEHWGSLAKKMNVREKLGGNGEFANNHFRPWGTRGPQI